MIINAKKSTMKYTPVSINMVRDLLYFFQSGEVTSRTVPRSLIGTSTDAKSLYAEIITRLTFIKDNIYKLKQNGIISADSQLLYISQITNDEDDIKAYFLAYVWYSATTVNDAYLTKKNLFQLINRWISYHRERIGMRPMPLKLKPEQMKYPDDYYTEKFPLTMKIVEKNGIARQVPDKQASISVLQAETLLLNLVNKYPNDNDIIIPNAQEQEALSIIQSLSTTRTEFSKTSAGVQYAAKKMFADSRRIRQEEKYLQKKASEYDKQEEILKKINEGEKLLDSAKTEMDENKRKAAAIKQYMKDNNLMP